MTHVPDYSVVWGIENIVECHGKFNRTHRRGEMTWILAEGVDQEIADLAAHLRQPVLWQVTEIRRTVYMREQRIAHLVETLH